jgi:hypothetical protein
VAQRYQTFYVTFYDHLFSYTEPIPVQLTNSDYSGYAYFGPAFVTRLVDYWPDGKAEFAKGWMIATDPIEGLTLLYRLGGRALQVENVQRLVMPSGTDLQATAIAANIAWAPVAMPGGHLAEAAISSLAPGDDSNLAVVLALYQEAGSQPSGGASHGDSTGAPARLLIGQVGTGDQVALVDSAEITGAPAPALDEAHVVILPRRQQVLLVGRDPAGTATPVAYRLCLPEGTWSGPQALSALGARDGFTLAYDAIGDQLLVFGGRVGGGLTSAGTYSAELFSIDPDSLVARLLSAPEPDAAGRWRAGLYLNAPDRQLFVVGGARGDASMADGFVLDLSTGVLTTLDLTAGPGAVVAPFVYYDRQTAALWVGDLEGTSTADGLDLWMLDKGGGWLQVPTVVGPERPAFPYAGSFLPGRVSELWVDTPASVALPGQVMLATVQASQGSLRAAVGTSAGNPLGSSTPGGAGFEQVGFLCPAGGTCRIALSLRAADLWSGGAIPFTLNMQEAALHLVDTLVLPVPAEDMVLYREALVLVGPLGLGVLNPATLEWLSFAMGQGLTAAQAVAPCGAYLCLAHLGLSGLQVLDLSNPADPRLRGGASALGPGWDVTAAGRRVFVAHGIQGVGVYDLDGQGRPTFRQTLGTGGVLRSVAAKGAVLVAARQAGVVRLFRLGETIQPAGSIQGFGQIERVRFVGGRLWILSRKNKQADQVDIYAVDDPDAPRHLGRITQDAARTFRSQWLGTRVYATSGLGHLLEVSRVEGL